MYGINISMTRLPVSLAYTVWTALGTLVVTLIGAAWFQEPIGAQQMVCLAMITEGVIGLNLQEE
jgi:small multidrug resistance pump